MNNKSKTFEFGFRGRPLTCTVTGRDEIRKAQQLYDSIEDEDDGAWGIFADAGYMADIERNVRRKHENPNHS